jgi:hypothetical protein
MKAYFALPILLIAIAGIALATNTSSGGEFTVTSPIYANWTNSYAPNITLTNNTNNSMVNIFNATSSVVNSTYGSAPFLVVTNNSIPLPVNMTISFLTTGLNPGRYSGVIIVYNSTNATENTSITATLDVPITLLGGYGGFSGNITNASTERYYFNMSNVTGAAGLNVTVNTNGNFTVTVYDNASVAVASQSTTAGNTLLWNVSGGHSYPLGGMWYILASGGVTNSSFRFNGTVQVNQSSLRVNSSFVSGTAPIAENIGYNKTVSYIFNIENNAAYNVTLQNISTNGPFLNLSTNYMVWTHNLTEGTVVPNGTTVPVQINVTINTLNTTNALGSYSGWLFMNTTNGFPWSNYNLSITATLSNSLVVSVTAVSNDTQVSNVTTTGSFINITVVPKFQNGTVVTGLLGGNFTATMTHTTIGSCTVTLTNVTVNVTAGSSYLLKALVPTTGGCGQNNAVVGGNYSVLVNAVDTTGQNHGSGTWPGNLTINESALSIAAFDTSTGNDVTSFTKTTSDVVTLAPRVYNYGAKDATGVLVNQTVSGGCSLTGGVNPIYINSGNVPGWSTGSVNGTNTWIFTMNTAGSCTINLTGYSSSGAWTLWTRNILITIQNASVSNNNVQMTTGAATTPAPTSSVDLSITDWPKYVSIVQGNSKSVDIVVMNSGSLPIQSLQTSVDGIDASWSKGTELSSLNAGQNFTLPITFNIPASAEVKNYSIVFVATSSNATARASANLAILPSQNTTVVLNATLTNLTAQYNDLLRQLEAAVSRGSNVSSANATLSEVKALIDQANGYAAAGDWLSVSNLITQVQSALNNAQTKISVLNNGGISIIGGTSGVNTYLIAGGAVVIVAIGAVLIWMKRTGVGISLKASKPAAPVLKQDGQGRMVGLKEKVKNLFKRKGTQRYMYHYQPGK